MLAGGAGAAALAAQTASVAGRPCSGEAGEHKDSHKLKYSDGKTTDAGLKHRYIQW